LVCHFTSGCNSLSFIRFERKISDFHHQTRWYSKNFVPCHFFLQLLCLYFIYWMALKVTKTEKISFKKYQMHFSDPMLWLLPYSSAPINTDGYGTEDELKLFHQTANCKWVELKPRNRLLLSRFCVLELPMP